MDISENCHLPKASDAAAFFDALLAKTGDVRIKALFSATMTYGYDGGRRVYWLDEKCYIIFENDECLTVDFPFIDKLHLQYRRMTPEEREIYEASDIKDYFNYKSELYDPAAKRFETRSIALEYDALDSIELRIRTTPYEVSASGSEEKTPTPETFDEITFFMKNGKRFTICPEDAVNDGYADVYSGDAVERHT